MLKMYRCKNRSCNNSLQFKVVWFFWLVIGMGLGWGRLFDLC